MASATSVSTNELLSPGRQWADKIRQNLTIIAPYDAADNELPPSIIIDESIMDAPRRRAADPIAAALAKEIAQRLYPSLDGNPLGPIIQYEKDIVKLRNLVIQQRKRAIELATQRNSSVNWAKRILDQGAWNPVEDPVSLDGTLSIPMPVGIAEPESLEPFFEHIRLGGTERMDSSPRGVQDAIVNEEPYYGTELLEFKLGVLYSDQRMDLCKTEVGPTNIGALLESLKTNEFIKHFLLGNNIIGPYGASCIADFLKEYPNRIDTWYLAGNCIDAASFKLLVDQWVRSSSVTNIWLKRNALGPSAVADIFRLITQTPHLRTLDLDQTELGDAGVAELFTKLAKHKPDMPLPLRHIYLNAVGIGEKGAAAIATYLESPHCTIDSLYATNNPMSSAGVKALAGGLQTNTTLTRLTLASVGMGDEGAVALCEALAEHSTLSTLDLGQSYSTPDLGMRYNWISDRSAYAIHNLIKSSSTLSYLNLGQCAMTHTGLNEILAAVATSPSLLYYFGKTIHPQLKTAFAIKAGQQHVALSKLTHTQLVSNVKRVYGADMDYDKFTADEKRWLVNDKTDVRKIDSVYRNRQAGLARRGQTKLEKLWEEGDQTLEEVMRGAVGPMCTKKRMPVAVVEPTLDDRIAVTAI